MGNFEETNDINFYNVKMRAKVKLLLKMNFKNTLFFINKKNIS
jgi:hypothetical protein